MASDSSGPRYRPGERPLGGDDDAADGLRVETERGTLSQGDVDRALESNLDTLVSCYDRAGEARKYASGQVTLRFLVAKTGQVSDVLVVDSTLGNYPVERCLVVEGRKITLPPPDGDKAADFEYNLRFRSSGEVGVVDWDPDALARDVSSLGASLASCGPVGPGPVRAVVYVQPGGAVSSAGLSSDRPLEPMAAMCAVEQIRKWRLPDDRGHVVRTSFRLPSSATALNGPERRLVRRVPPRRR